MTFTTIFQYGLNVHLMKDVGQIPYTFGKYFGYSSKFVCYKNENLYTYANELKPYLTLHFVPHYLRFLSIEFSIVLYILCNARKINVLNLYHLRRESIAYGLLYKTINPKGILYIKLDTYNKNIENREYLKFSKSKFINALFKMGLNKLFNHVNVMSIENFRGLELIRKIFCTKALLLYLPNCVNYSKIVEYKIKVKKWNEKDNIILTVGRIGSPEKGHSKLLEIITKLDIKNWKFLFVGPISKDFMSVINLFHKNFPNKKDRVIFTGNISDKKQLYKLYNKSKIFILPSMEEAAPLALVEASYFGNYLIGTLNIDSFHDVTNNYRFGKTYSDDTPLELINILQKIINNEVLNDFNTLNVHNHCKEHFIWEKSLLKLIEVFKIDLLKK